MPTSHNSGALNQARPSDPHTEAHDRPAQPLEGEPEELRGISDTERRAGTPDPRATTDWNHGEGETPGSGAA
jgi:hypothetical protein